VGELAGKKWLEAVWILAFGCFARGLKPADYLAQPEGLAEAALFMHFGNDFVSEGALLSMLLIPGQPLIIEYSPQTPSS
jgi:hypothetical protein